jgi:hypothetical protein
MLHQKGKDVAAFMTSETVKYLLVGAYRKGWGFLLVKGTEAQVVFPGFFQDNRFGHDINDIRGVPDVSDFVFRNITGQHLLP